MDLSAPRVLDALDRLGAEVGRPLAIAMETGSTNDDARRAAAEGAPHGACFVADAQTAGRGRGGHAWHSPPGSNLYLSMVLRPTVPAGAVAPITLAVGLAVARVVARVVSGSIAAPGAHRSTDVEGRERAAAGEAEGARSGAAGEPLSRSEVRLKWPNDVLVDGRKIAGVLVEGQLRGDRVVSLIAGIGLNVRTVHFPPELEGRATSLALSGAGEQGLDRSLIAAGIIAEVGTVVRGYEAAGLGRWLDEIRAIDGLRGRAVEVGSLRGVGAGIDDAGRLLVRDAAGAVQAVASGEVLFGGTLGG